MGELPTLVIQAADVWGDEDDSLGHDRRLLEKAAQYRATEHLMILLPTHTRCERAVEFTAGHTAGSPQIQEFVENADLAGAFDLYSVEEIVVVCRGARAIQISSLDRQIRLAGFQRCGRAWGAAGETRRYVRPESLNTRLVAVAQEARVHAGAVVVRVRDGWAQPLRRAFGNGRAALGWGVHKRDVLDEDWGAPHEDRMRWDVRDVLPPGAGTTLPTWTINVDANDAPGRRARACFEEHGVWPISFSYPSEPLPLAPHPAHLIAPIIPGLPYSFADERTYLETYAGAFLGVTHRKAGWDCFRHLEILASGAVPLMLDAEGIPGYAMVHYPTDALRAVRDSVSRTGGAPSDTVREAFRAWFGRHLTSRVLARYILESAGLDDDARVLFVDERLPVMPDYQSVLTLIGLQQLLGTRCDVAFPVDYIYEDTRVDTAQLYGRGFGYSRALPADFRSTAVSATDQYDAVIIGSVTRNMALARKMLREAPSRAHIWIHGEDTPPTPGEVAELRNSGAHLFIRAIHTGPRGRG